MEIFVDRADAGARLGALLAERVARWPAPVVLGILRGGVVVADAVARVLGLELDLLGVEKIGAPWNHELAIGAVGEGDVLWLDPELVAMVEATQLRESVERERAELAGKLADVRRIRPRVDLAGRAAIVVDDGIATGSTVRAALLALESARPERRVLAVPVGPRDTLDALARVADEVVCPLRPRDFRAVGEWYRVFDQTSQRRVVEIFARRAAADPVS